MGEMSVDMARLKMVTELDMALHGTTVARDQTPQEVWHDLLGKVMMFRDRIAALEDLLDLAGRVARTERTEWFYRDAMPRGTDG